MTDNPAGRPNISNPALDENGNFASVWFKLFLQLWIRTGGSSDDMNRLRDGLELIELIPKTVSVKEDDLAPSIVAQAAQDDLSPQSVQTTQDFDLAPV